VSAYLTHQVQRGFHPTTIAGRAQVLGWLVAWCAQQGHPPGAPLDRPTIARFQQALATPDGPQGAAALSYARQVTAASHLRRFGLFLVAQGLHIENPCAALAVPRRGFTLPGTLLSLAQVRTLLDRVDLSAPHGLRDRALLEVAYATGASSEALGRLALTDLEPVPGAPRRDPHRIGAWVTIRPRPPGHPRRVPLGERAWWWVARYQCEARPAVAQRETARGGMATALFLSQWGHPLHNRDVALVVGTHLRRAGLPSQGSTRLLRDSLAVHLLDAGSDVRVVAALLGLADFSSVRRYARASGGLLCDLHARFHPGERGLVPDVGRRAAPPSPLPPPSLPLT
jgi:integrase/recombinase XerD